MKASRPVMAGLVAVLALSLFAGFAQSTPPQKQEPAKPAPKQPQKEILPKEIKAIIQEGLANKQGRQDIPFTIFKTLTFPVGGGMHVVVLFKAKNADLGYAAPVASGKNQQAPAGLLEAHLAVALQDFQPDAAGVQKAVREAGFAATLQMDGAGYDPNKEEWYSIGYPVPYGKYTMALFLSPMDMKKNQPDLKKVGVAYVGLDLPTPEALQNVLDTTPLFFAKNIEQMPTYEARTAIHRGYFTYSILKITPNIDDVITAEDKGQIETLFFVLGAKPKPETAGQGQPTYDIEVNFEVQKPDGSPAIKWQPQTYPSTLIDQSLPLKRTLKTGDKTEVKELEPGKYNLALKITDKVSTLTLEKKITFEVK
ncbi:MAG TPA: hypothetical protein VMS75_01030 [Terriglobales bacterium]|nr:hypothetical protein [Terriglobales bacterium]